MGGTSASSKQADPCWNLWKNLSRLDSALPSLLYIIYRCEIKFKLELDTADFVVFILYTGTCILYNHTVYKYIHVKLVLSTDFFFKLRN